MNKQKIENKNHKISIQIKSLLHENLINLDNIIIFFYKIWYSFFTYFAEISQVLLNHFNNITDLIVRLA